MLVSVSIWYGSNLHDLDPIEIYKRQCLLTTAGYHRIPRSKCLGYEARLCRESTRDPYDVLAGCECIYEKSSIMSQPTGCQETTSAVAVGQGLCVMAVLN